MRVMARPERGVDIKISIIDKNSVLDPVSLEIPPFLEYNTSAFCTMHG